MVRILLFRLFYNCILSYLLVYVDLVIPHWNEGENTNRRMILIIIGYYSTSYFLLKALLAIYHQLKWILTCTRCCTHPLEPQDRLQAVQLYWRDSNSKYLAL